MAPLKLRLKAALVTALCTFLLHPTWADEIILTRSASGILEVPVIINDTLKLNFTLDSGAAAITITPDLFSTLVRSGTITPADVLSEGETYILADGSTVTAHTVLLKEVSIGSTTLHNVEAAIFSAPQSGLLLGQTFLSRLPGWSIDNERGVLVITEPETATTKLFWRDNDEFSVLAGADWNRDHDSEGDTFKLALSDEAEGGFFGVLEIEQESGARQLAIDALCSIENDFDILDEEWFEVHHAGTEEVIPATIFTVRSKDEKDSARDGYVATFRYGGWSYVLMGFWDTEVYDDYPAEIFGIFESFTLHWIPD